MRYANVITQNRMTKEELEKCSEFGLKLGHYVLHRGEQCRVTAVEPLEFTLLSDMPPESDGWPTQENISIGFYVI